MIRSAKTGRLSRVGGCFLLLLSLAQAGRAWDGSQALIIDHTCKDISIIPRVYLESVKDGKKCHYAHTSHGMQISIGLDLIEEQVHCLPRV